MRTLLHVALYFLVVGFTMAQTQTSWRISAGLGTVYAHTVDVENTKGSRPVGFQLDYAWQRTDSTTYQKFSSLPMQGISLSAYHFDNSTLGNGYTLSYFIQPEIRITNRTGITFPASAGMSYLTMPYHPITNPGNNSYSTSLIAYLGISIQPYVQLTDQWQLLLTGSFRHVSNGGIKLPNKGINWITTEVGVQYYIHPKKDMQKVILRHRMNKLEKQNRLDLYMFGATRSINSQKATRYAVIGIGASHVWQTGYTHALSIGAECYRDAGAAVQMQNDGITGRSAIRSGIMLGHEFLWGHFRFTQQVGIYIFNQTPYYKDWYHRWGLFYAFNKHFSIGGVLKAHKQVAAFPDVRLVYNFSK